MHDMVTRTWLVGALAMMLAQVEAVRAAEPVAVQFALEAAYDDNIGLAERQADREEDFVTSLSGAVKQTLVLGSRSALVIRATAKYHEFIDFSDLSHGEVGVGARWYFQPTPGFTSPWYALSADWLARRHVDSAIRDGTTVRLGASTGRRFTDKLSGELGYSYSNRNSRRGQVFDTEQHRVFSALEWVLDGGTTLYGNYSVSQGDVVSTARPNAVIIAAADALANDPAFGSRGAMPGPGPAPGPGPGPMPAGSGFVSYQLDATVRSLELGMNVPVDSLTALDFSVARLDATATSSIDYNRVQLRAGLLRRF